MAQSKGTPMKEFIIPVNNEAHSRALEAVVGPETAQAILRAYKAIDSAMVFGYERGLKEAAEAALVNDVEDREPFEAGYDAGYADAEVNDRNRALDYDDGYVAGVSDARLYPADADREVARLCSEEEYGECNVSDSGDETGPLGFIR
jgi:uncharacterized protein with von Willebrand factor type A (vWA) domain